VEGRLVSAVVDLRVWGVDRVAPALLRMGTGRRALRRAPGLQFAKLLGTGSGESFTLRDADPHHWALLTVFADEAAADRFAGGRLVSRWQDAAAEQLAVRLRPLTARGRWSRREPFPAAGGPAAEVEGPVAALTRARLRPSRAVGFWRSVPPVVADLRDAPGLRLSLGIGEAPVGLQGTFSLWDSQRALVDFAYRGAAHRDVVARTGPQRWYAEELFARFAVLDVQGSYRGRRP
jgi:hypothetical protein